MSTSPSRYRRSRVMALSGFAIALAIGAAGGLVLASEPGDVPVLRTTVGEASGGEPILLAERWAASPLILRSRAMTQVSPAVSVGESAPQAEDQMRARAMPFALAATALLGFSLLESLLFVLIDTASRTPRHLPARPPAVGTRPQTEAEYEAKCQQLFQTITALWAKAETAVFDLDEALPLRSLLFKEMKQISERLAMDPSLRVASAGAVTARHEVPYWRGLSQRLNQSARDLNRIGAVAEAAGAGFGSRSSEPRIPKTRDEACFILGANREADPETLQRLVKALRQCWHPDLGQTDADRRHREARIKQINAAHDLITGKRVEG